MTCLRLSSVLILLTLALVLLSSGCGGDNRVANRSGDEANSRVEAVKRLADAMAKNPNGTEAQAVLEELRVTPIDVTANRKQAEEALQIYNQRIRGKYQGEVAQEVHGIMLALEANLKQAK